MDLHMPTLNGIEATRRIVHHSPHVGILVLTMLEEDASIFAAIRAGARGYLLKGADRDEIVRAVRAIAAGEAIFGPAIAQRVIEYFADPDNPGPPLVFPELTESGAGSPRPRRPGSQQRHHRSHPVPQPQDHPQPHLEHLRQAPRR